MTKKTLYLIKLQKLFLQNKFMIKFYFYLSSIKNTPYLFAQIYEKKSPKPIFICPFSKNSSLLFFGAIRTRKEFNHMLTFF